MVYFSVKTVPNNQRTLSLLIHVMVNLHYFFSFNDFGFSIHVAHCLDYTSIYFFGHVYL